MNNTARKVGAAFGLAAIAGFSVALPASATTTVGEWGVFGDSTNGNDSSLTFTNPDFPGADIMIWDEGTFEYLAPADESEGFSVGDPLGDLVGANLDSTADNIYKVTTAADNDQESHIEITFTSPVPAGQLVLAVSDIDSDRVEISMLDDTDADVAYEDIVGTASGYGFNWYDISDNVNVPAIDSNGANTVRMNAAPDGTDGSTGWVRPSVPVSKITLDVWTEDGNQSSQRIWIGQVEEGEDDLADTGVNDSLYLGVIAGGALLATGGAIALRRRQA